VRNVDNESAETVAAAEFIGKTTSARRSSLRKRDSSEGKD